MIIQAGMMAVGIALTILELQVEQPDGVVLLIAGMLFGLGLHWYRRKRFNGKTLVVGGLMAVAFPLGVGAAVMQAGLLALLAAIAAGIGIRMVR